MRKFPKTHIKRYCTMSTIKTTVRYYFKPIILVKTKE